MTRQYSCEGLLIPFRVIKSKVVTSGFAAEKESNGARSLFVLSFLTYFTIYAAPMQTPSKLKIKQ
jgi:hypothetical protein